MIEITFRSISTWPGNKTPGQRRERSRFSAKYRDTLDLLDRELRQLKGKNVVIQLECEPSQIRRDGLPRSDARTNGPGVILSFDSPKGSLSFPCDHFTGWEDNLRAIALALEALRTVDRYHVTQNNEQYRGWTALPAPGLDEDAALHWLWDIVGTRFSADDLRRTEKLRSSVRQRAMVACHPDRHNGDDAAWKKWQTVARIFGIEI